MFLNSLNPKAKLLFSQTHCRFIILTDIEDLCCCLFLFKAMSMEGQDSMFGQENSVAAAQSSSQTQLSEQDNKIDDSIDNQQQVCVFCTFTKSRVYSLFMANVFLFFSQRNINGDEVAEVVFFSLGHGTGRGPRWNG